MQQMNETTRPDDAAPTLRDVAAVAGVSHQTVSRVVAGSPHVAGPTRSRVEAAIAALAYRPDEAARLLASRRRSA